MHTLASMITAARKPTLTIDPPVTKKVTPVEKKYPALVESLAKKAGVTLSKAKKEWDFAEATVQSENPKLDKNVSSQLFYSMVTNKFKQAIGLNIEPTNDLNKFDKYIDNLSDNKDKLLAKLPKDKAKELMDKAIKINKRLGLEGSKFIAHTFSLFKSLAHHSVLNLGDDPKLLQGTQLTKTIDRIAKEFGVDKVDISRYFKETEEQFKTSDYKPGTKDYVTHVLQKVMQRAEYKRSPNYKGAKVAASIYDRITFHVRHATSLRKGQAVQADAVGEPATDGPTDEYAALNPAQTVYKAITDFEEHMFTAVGGSNFSKLDNGLQLDVSSEDNTFNGTVTITKEADGTYTLTGLKDGTPSRRISKKSVYDLAPSLFKLCTS